MMVIGLGRAGCSIARAFAKFPQYETYGIDTTKDADITIQQRPTHEDYEANFPNLKRKLKVPPQGAYVITCGAGNISGGILRLLQQLGADSIHIIYVQPDLELMSETQKKQEKIVRNVLQEYARSGAVAEIILVDNALLEKSIGDMSIIGYYDTLNQAIVNTVHMVNVFRNSAPVIGNFIEAADISRIATMGIVNMETGGEEENWFYDLRNVRDMVYYYGIHEEQLKNDGTLFRKINNFVKSKIEDNTNVSYGVFKTTYEQKYCYCIKYSSVVQSYTELDDQEIS
tara:strand:+ start:202 stop:1056 length:855 start_codon:yes stop_codon:yes gene_type:complete